MFFVHAMHPSNQIVEVGHVTQCVILLGLFEEERASASKDRNGENEGSAFLGERSVLAGLGSRVHRVPDECCSQLAGQDAIQSPLQRGA